MGLRKSDIRRPYAPDFASRTTIAYRLDISLSKLSDLISKGDFPRPAPGIDGLERWWWPDVEAFMLGKSGGDDTARATNEGLVDPYITRIKNRVATA
jgi:hypothetical protein